MSNPYPMPAPGAAQSLEKINEELRAMLERESMARIEARTIWGALAKAMMDDDRPAAKRLMLELFAVLS